ncbi:MAG TPA: hypothetical protein VF220_02920 [Nitrososphaeraceae archaeon]
MLLEIYGFDALLINAYHLRKFEYMDDILNRVILYSSHKYNSGSITKFLQLTRTDNPLAINKSTDIITINKIGMKNVIKKRVRKELGLEVSLSDIRYSSGDSISKWVKESRSIYRLCKSSGSQFILSSGARTLAEMVSIRTIESILLLLEIEPKNYWKDFSEWLDSKDKIRVIKC